MVTKFVWNYNNLVYLLIFYVIDLVQRFHQRPFQKRVYINRFLRFTAASGPITAI